MGHAYRAVGWNPQKRRYDLWLGVGIFAYLATFVAVGLAVNPSGTAETQLIRGLGTGAFVLLHLILSIGPLARLSPRFLPLLYNRRHLGVAMFVLALAHGVFSLLQFHAFGNVNPLQSVLTSNPRLGSLTQFPFELFGVLALSILFLMAATSHDFWLANLTAPVWKALHMLVYVAYGAVVLHVATGTLQTETCPLMVGTFAAGFVWIFGLHLFTGWKEAASDRPAMGAKGAQGADGFVDVGPWDMLQLDRGVTVSLGGDRVAIYLHEGGVSALSNACQHQNGPLGEGRIQNGCIVCPWHGYEYQPDCGKSPEPFTEAVPTFRVRIEGERLLVHPTPLPPGTPVPPAQLPEALPHA